MESSTSPREGLDETLTVIGIGLPKLTARLLSTTNLFENLIRQALARPAENPALGAAGLGEAEQGFRRLKGYRTMPALVDALKRHDDELN